MTTEQGQISIDAYLGQRRMLLAVREGPWVRLDRPWLDSTTVFGPSLSWPTGFPDNPDGHITNVCNCDCADGDQRRTADLIAALRNDEDRQLDVIDAAVTLLKAEDAVLDGLDRAREHRAEVVAVLRTAVAALLTSGRP